MSYFVEQRIRLIRIPPKEEEEINVSNSFVNSTISTRFALKLNVEVQRLREIYECNNGVCCELVLFVCPLHARGFFLLPLETNTFVVFWRWLRYRVPALSARPLRSAQFDAALRLPFFSTGRQFCAVGTCGCLVLVSGTCLERCAADSMVYCGNGVLVDTNASIGPLEGKPPN